VAWFGEWAGDSLMAEGDLTKIKSADTMPTCQCSGEEEVAWQTQLLD
jgi:hypothetical protein